MKKALILTTNMGHKSIADACAQALERSGWKTKIFNSIFVETKLVYEPIYKLIPILNKIYFRLGKKKEAIKKFEKGFSNRKISQIRKIINIYRPDLIISTYPGYNPAIGKIKKKQKIAFINVIANPITFHPIEVSPSADINIVYSQKTEQKVINLGLEAEKVKAIGWLTKKAFYKKTEKDFNKKLTILFCAGSLGAQNTIKFLPIFNRLKKPLKLILVAGKNNFLFRIFKIYQKINWLLAKLAVNNLDIDVYQFTENMPNLMAESDVVVGKAGPNLIFEAIASKKPFIAVSYIPGQEDGNLKLIKEKRLGWVCLKPEELEKTLFSITKNGKKLESIRKSVLEERKYNLSAKERLSKIAAQLVGLTP